MGEELKVSAADDIHRVTLLVALPVPQDGVTIVLRIGAVKNVTVIEAMDGLPGVNVAPAEAEKPDWASVRGKVVDSIGPAERLASAGILEPAFSFGAREEGKAYWDDLLPDNQAFVVKSILDLSGWGGKPSEGGTTFREGDPK